MKGFVLAAGFGTRMRPVTESVPKALLPIGQVPLIGYSLRLLAHHGIYDVIVNTHHLAQTLKHELGDGSRFGVSIQYSDEEEILGTGGALKRMQSELDDTFVVLNSDTIIDLDLDAAIHSHRNSGAIATMVLREDPDFERYGSIEIDEENRVRRLLGVGGGDERLRGFMFTGNHVLSPGFLEFLPPEVESCVIHYGYRKALDNDQRINGYIHRGAWMDAGTPERYFRLHDTAMAGELELRHVNPLEDTKRAGESTAAPTQQFRGIRVDRTSTVHPSAHLRAPVSIGPNAKVAADVTLGPGTVVGAKASIAKGTHLERSVVLPGVKVEPGVNLRNAVVASKDRLILE